MTHEVTVQYPICEVPVSEHPLSILILRVYFLLFWLYVSQIEWMDSRVSVTHHLAPDCVCCFARRYGCREVTERPLCKKVRKVTQGSSREVGRKEGEGVSGVKNGVQTWALRKTVRGVVPTGPALYVFVYVNRTQWLGTWRLLRLLCLVPSVCLYY